MMKILWGIIKRLKFHLKYQMEKKNPLEIPIGYKSFCVILRSKFTMTYLKEKKLIKIYKKDYNPFSKDQKSSLSQLMKKKIF